MPPTRRDVEDFTFGANSFVAAGCETCFGVKSEEPFNDAER